MAVGGCSPERMVRIAAGVHVFYGAGACSIGGHSQSTRW